ncbi:MAG: NAD(P)/FAD-dependent oxidoreductase, partial [Holophagales bacterium]|nr:NAD(P)/FAD-dependent oxidoreductase [Holophagales bacterium]
RFPAERRGIARFLEAVDRIGQELEGGMSVRSLRHLVQLPGRIPTIARLGFRSLSSVFDRFGIQDPVLRTLLGAQSGDHGMPPDRAAFVLHAAIVHHYFEGGWYPKGGGRSLPKAFIKELRAHGGEIRMRAAVERILVEGSGRARRAVAVRLTDGTEISAETIVSNADPEATFRGMVGEEHLSRKLRRRLRSSTYSVSALSLFLGVDMDLRAAGLDSGNVWYYGTPDLQHAYDVRAMGLPKGPVDTLFLTATTLKDRSKRSDGLHTLEAFTFVPWEPFRRWEASRSGQRSSDYEATKAEITDHMFAGIERIVPGLRRNVVFEALGTPLTNRHYVASTEGNIYGTEKRRLQLGPFAMRPTTEIEGLFLCGASTSSHGVAGAMISGVSAACRALGCRRRDVLTGTGTLRTEPCEPAEGETAVAMAASGTAAAPAEAVYA